jgi:hypothetical protein
MWLGTIKNPTHHLGWAELLCPLPHLSIRLFFKMTNGSHTSVSPAGERFFFFKTKKEACPGKAKLLRQETNCYL